MDEILSNGLTFQEIYHGTGGIAFLAKLPADVLDRLIFEHIHKRPFIKKEVKPYSHHCLKCGRYSNSSSGFMDECGYHTNDCNVTSNDSALLFAISKLNSDEQKLFGEIINIVTASFGIPTSMLMFVDDTFESNPEYGKIIGATIIRVRLLSAGKQQ